MKILIAGLVKSPQLARLVEEGEMRGHQIEGCYASELTIVSGTDSFIPTLRGKLFDYDLVYLWTVGKRRWEWYTAAFHLNKTKGIKFINHKVIDPSYNYFLTPAIDYLNQTDESLPYPKSAIIFSHMSVDSVIDDFTFPLILKTALGRQGKGVFLLNSREEVVEKIKELKDISPSFVIREFIPNDGDIRVFTVGYEAIGAMKRTPSTDDEFRSNISQGGIGSEFDLSTRSDVRELAEKASRVMRTEIAGVDVILDSETDKPCILEVNPGPQFTGFEEYTSTNAALEIVKYFEKIGGGN